MDRRVPSFRHESELVQKLVGSLIGSPATVLTGMVRIASVAGGWPGRGVVLLLPITLVRASQVVQCGGIHLPMQETWVQFHPWVRKIPWRREWLPTLVFLPEESHGQRSLADCHPWGHKELDTAEHACIHATLVKIRAPRWWNTPKI